MTKQEAMADVSAVIGGNDFGCVEDVPETDAHRTFQDLRLSR